MSYQDSTGKEIFVGDRVRFRGTHYTIASFHDGEGRCGTARIEFVEPYEGEIPDEIGVDKSRNLIDPLSPQGLTQAVNSFFGHVHQIPETMTFEHVSQPRYFSKTEFAVLPHQHKERNSMRFKVSEGIHAGHAVFLKNGVLHKSTAKEMPIGVVSEINQEQAMVHLLEDFKHVEHTVQDIVEFLNDVWIHQILKDEVKYIDVEILTPRVYDRQFIVDVVERCKAFRMSPAVLGLSRKEHNQSYGDLLLWRCDRGRESFTQPRYIAVTFMLSDVEIGIDPYSDKKLTNNEVCSEFHRELNFILQHSTSEILG